jgi:Right handed beta helix region
MAPFLAFVIPVSGASPPDGPLPEPTPPGIWPTPPVDPGWGVPTPPATPPWGGGWGSGPHPWLPGDGQPVYIVVPPYGVVGPDLPARAAPDQAGPSSRTEEVNLQTLGQAGPGGSGRGGLGNRPVRIGSLGVVRRRRLAAPPPPFQKKDSMLKTLLGALVCLLLSTVAHAVTIEEIEALDARLVQMETQLAEMQADALLDARLVQMETQLAEMQAEVLQLRTFLQQIADEVANALAPTPTPTPVVYTASGPITATAGQVIKRVRITGVSGGCIKVSNVTDVHIEDVILEGCGGHGVRLTNAHRVKIVNSRIMPKRTTTTLDTENGVMIVGSTDVLIQGNVFRDFESGVEVAQATTSHSIRVVGNYSEKPRGPFPRGQHVQFYPCNRDGPIARRCEVTDNHFWTDEADHFGGAGQEDAVNTGSHSTHVYYARNYIEGGGAATGCGLLVEGFGSNHALLEDNVLISTAGCGINITNAAFAVIRRNKLLGPFYTTFVDSGNVGIANWYHSGDTGCHDNQVYENIVANRLPTGSYSDIWLKSGCGSQTNNVKGSAATMALTPKETKLPPPSARGVAPKRWPE